MLFKNALAMLKKHGKNHRQEVRDGTTYHLADVAAGRTIAVWECCLPGQAGAHLNVSENVWSFSGKSLTALIRWCKKNPQRGL